MRYLTFKDPEPTTYEVCFLMPRLQKKEIERHYLVPHLAGMEDTLLAYDLFKNGKTTKVAEQREYLGKLLPILQTLGVKYLVVTDAEYFKTLTKGKSTEAGLGYVFPSAPVIEANLSGGEFQVIYCPHYSRIFYNPEKIEQEIRISLNALKNHRNNTYDDPGLDIIHFAAYPDTVGSIRTWLVRLLDMHCDLSGDIECFSLKHYDAGIGTISFSWNKHEGIAFPIDLLDNVSDQIQVRHMLVEFFAELKARGHKIIWHRIAFDVTVLIYQLYMTDILDTEGLLRGMDVLLDKWECTLLITYLATNSCAGNRLGLKFQAQEFAGDWGLDDEDYKDIRKIPLADLLQYNLVDTLSTWYVFEKHHSTMVRDGQEPLYEGLFKSSMKDIIQMQLTGMPLNMVEVIRLNDSFKAISQAAEDRMQANPALQRYLAVVNQEWVDMKNATLKKKRVTLLDAKEDFNPGSSQQLQRILYDENQMALPVLDLTDSKLPATKASTLEKLINHTTDPDIKSFLEDLIEYKSLDKLITSFLPAMLDAPMGPDGWHYLFGNFNLGGTISGRLSSSGPNLQNIPANGKTPLKKKLAKAIKKCFQAPPGWLFVGLDFSSLEDRISALTTKDPNKLKVYTDGFDGHCLRAYGYFDDQMPDIIPDDVVSINSIAVKYPALRQDSKTPTFLLTYQGTWVGIMHQLGWTEEKARLIESRYHALYVVSDQWVESRIEEAGRDGYLTVAFGLRLRTPMLHQVIMGTNRTPYEAIAESRSAGNACGQSYGLLNNRASVEFMTKVRTSPYRLSIRPCAQIHDAQYYMIQDTMDEILFTNDHLVAACEWQNDPLIAHPIVKLGGNLSVFFPNWSTGLEIPNKASADDIKSLALEHISKYCP